MTMLFFISYTEYFNDKVTKTKLIIHETFGVSFCVNSQFEPEFVSETRNIDNLNPHISWK